MLTTQPTKKQVSEMMKDWLGNLRDSETFVHKDRKNAIMNSSGTKMSKYILGSLSDKDDVEILKASRELAQGLVNGMVKNPVRVQVGGKSSFTNGQFVNISVEHFGKQSLSLNDKVDIFLGLAIHESCHLNHTPFVEKKNSRKETDKLRHLITNILEDERIEYLLGDSRHPESDNLPGYCEYIAAVKKYYFDQYKNDPIDPSINSITSFLNALLLVVRFPSALNEDFVKENYDVLSRIKKALLPFPLTFARVEKTADKLIEVLKDLAYEEEQEQQEQQEQNESGEGESSDGNGNNPQGTNSDEDNVSDETQTTSTDGNPNQQNSSCQNGDMNGTNINSQSSSTNNTGNDSPAAKKKTPAQEKAEKSAALEKALSQGDVQDAMEVLSEQGKYNESDSTTSFNVLDEEYINGDSEKCAAASGKDYFIRKTEKNKNSFLRSYDRIKKYIPSMTKALRCRTTEKDYELKGMESGRLNTNKLASLKAGNKGIFTQKGKVTCDKACVCLLIDESGSMHGENEVAARDTAILIAEAIKNIPNLEAFVYGFTSSMINVYAEGNKIDRYCLGSITNMYGTPTGDAMEIVAKKLRKMTSNECIMLVVTDGQPDDESKVREQDKKLRKIGFLPIGIGICGCTTSHLFQESVSFNEISTLAPEIGKIVKKRLQKILKTHDSN